MAERSIFRLWAMRAVFFGIALLIAFVHLLPLETTPRSFAGPDLLTAFVFAWVLRRPDYLPPVCVALVMLLADMLFQRPPGLWALLVLLASEWLKSQDRRLRENTIFAEWLTVALALFIITVLYRVILSLLIVAPGTSFLAAMQFTLTLAVYPLVTAITYLVFGVRRSAPGEFDPVGRSL